ncbi:hypothetical protein VTK73DRAFT_2547 [Phialemonium thermophilum]|uniref:JmjC domain-containing protein n=1 Tax=Phialemonium thermophilum TaxID=223376 RepID=A0ABR3VRZ8_9PEZI
MVFHKTVDLIPDSETGKAANERMATSVPPATVRVPRITITSTDEFENILQNGSPVILEGLGLGPCVSQWTLERLVDKIGPDQKVVVHESQSRHMDFNTKNFSYKTVPMAEFARAVAEGGRLYLRALSADEPAGRPARLAEDFPDLASDFSLPNQLEFVAANEFSSVLRVSGPVDMWLHYDVMANVYCQINGSKRLVLFPPSDVEHLSFAPGASSSSLDVFSGPAGSASSSPPGAPTASHPHEALLSPGDVLFLPALWPHAATPTAESGVSIAVNVFFRDLGPKGDDSSIGVYSTGRDVYGNRDLAPYEKGRQDIARIAGSFRKLPASAREFYLLRLADELRQRARN